MSARLLSSGRDRDYKTTAQEMGVELYKCLSLMLDLGYCKDNLVDCYYVYFHVTFTFPLRFTQKLSLQLKFNAK